MTGTIKTLGRGFAFIRPDETETGRDIFLLYNGLQTTGAAFDNLRLGMRVEFTVIDHPKGPRAIECRVLA